MIIIQDSREQRPLQFSPEHTVIVEGMGVGDYGLQGFSDWNNPKFVCERKSLEDLVGSLTSERDRFFREIEKLRQFGFAAILVEAYENQVRSKQYRSMASPQSILASVDAIVVRSNIHVVWCETASGASERFCDLARQFLRGIQKQHDLAKTHVEQK